MLFKHIMYSILGMYLYRKNKGWDVKLNMLLDTAETVEVVDDTLGIRKPYNVYVVSLASLSFGTLLSAEGMILPPKLRGRPRFSTMRRLKALCDKRVAKEQDSLYK